MSSDKKNPKCRTVCSGCFRKDKAVTRVSAFLKGDFETVDLGFKCCSYECAKSVESKKYYKWIVHYAAQVPKFADKWNTAQRLYDDLEAKDLLKYDRQMYQIVIGNIVWKWRTNPACFETTDMLTLQIFMMLNSNFQRAYHDIKKWVKTRDWMTEFEKRHSSLDLLIEPNEHHENLYESFVNGILDSGILRCSEVLCYVKHIERWKNVIAILLARLKIYIIEDMESLLLEKREFFRKNRIASLFPKRSNIPDTLAIFIMGYSDSDMRRELKIQEKHLRKIFESFTEKNCNYMINNHDHEFFLAKQSIPFLPVAVLVMYFLFHQFFITLPNELLLLILSITVLATFFLVTMEKDEISGEIKALLRECDRKSQ